MQTLTATGKGLVLVVERDPAGWKTTVRSAANPQCAYVSSQIYHAVEDAQEAAVRIGQVVWGERMDKDTVHWHIAAARETSEGNAAAAAAG
jgi:hypothetical protein